MNHAKHANFYRIIEKRGKVTPLTEFKVSANPTTLWYLDVFRMLTQSRNREGFIPFSEMMSYANNMEIIGTKEEFVNILNAMDIAYNQYTAKRFGNKK